MLRGQLIHTRTLPRRHSGDFEVDAEPVGVEKELKTPASPAGYQGPARES